ncbi:hypothetical protein H4R34_005568 [Dimargaris verticillata]|uniref:Uncharacterized protein n=1 Tax=Dimargaris verticillata TaxID=2761393 RepID=A0A9W8E712_9FUNG|nr:hypothetical protein H4R34_005568 [Dimargaris verticillata]
MAASALLLAALCSFPLTQPHPVYGQGGATAGNNFFWGQQPIDLATTSPSSYSKEGRLPWNAWWNSLQLPESSLSDQRESVSSSASELLDHQSNDFSPESLSDFSNDSRSFTRPEDDMLPWNNYIDFNQGTEGLDVDTNLDASPFQPPKAKEHAKATEMIPQGPLYLERNPFGSMDLFKDHGYSAYQAYQRTPKAQINRMLHPPTSDDLESHMADMHDFYHYDAYKRALELASSPRHASQPGRWGVIRN